MENRNVSKKPLVRQVYDELFTSIEALVEFDETTINKLKFLSSNGKLKKKGKVLDAIKKANDNETTRT